jgi:peptide/nickel transport system substrate-binding protein
MRRFARIAAIFGLAWLSAAQPLGAAETPKRGGVLTFLIPADAPPSFDGHRENSFRDRAFGGAVLQQSDPR